MEEHPLLTAVVGTAVMGAWVTFLRYAVEPTPSIGLYSSLLLGPGVGASSYFRRQNRGW